MTARNAHPFGLFIWYDVDDYARVIYAPFFMAKLEAVHRLRSFDADCARHALTDRRALCECAARGSASRNGVAVYG